MYNLLHIVLPAYKSNKIVVTCSQIEVFCYSDMGVFSTNVPSSWVLAKYQLRLERYHSRRRLCGVCTYVLCTHIWFSDTVYRSFVRGFDTQLLSELAFYLTKTRDRGLIIDIITYRLPSGLFQSGSCLGLHSMSTRREWAISVTCLRTAFCHRAEGVPEQQWQATRHTCTHPCQLHPRLSNTPRQQVLAA